jgi:hypothetical protein
LRLRIFSTVALFALGLLIADRLAGALLERLARGVTTGEKIGRIQGALEARDREIMVFGSSRAKRHVDPAILEDTLGLRAYNAGALGQGLPYARMLEALLLERGTGAQFFVLQVDPVDLYVDRAERAGMFAVFYGESGAVDRILEARDPFARLKLLSHSYRFNSLLLSLLRHHFAPVGAPLGFEPRFGRIDVSRPGPDPAAGYPVGEMLPAMEQMLRDFLGDARRSGVRCLVIVTPRYRGGRPEVEWERQGWARLKEITEQEGAHFVPLDEGTPPFSDPELFADRAHLNARGAALLSEALAKEIARLRAGS